MNKTARYMMMRQGKESGTEYPERSTHRERGGYEMEDRFRDRRGREHYENGRYAPRNSYGGEMRSEGGMEYYGGTYSKPEEMRGTYGGDDEVYARMNTIGFGNRDYPGTVWESPRNGANVEHSNVHEMERYRGNRSSGGAYGAESELTAEMAQHWARNMHNSDGSTGAHWSMDQTKQLAQQRGINLPPEEFYAVINAMYSDYCEVAKKHNVHNADFYVDMAKAFLKDKDAVPNKAALYYECVVQH